MGLDMYLTQKHYVGNKWRKPEQQLKVRFPKTQDDAILPVKEGDFDESKISYIEEEVAYWRKANMIHDWFINNCANGEDDCREMYVDGEKLEELVTLCKEVLRLAKTNSPIPKDTKDYSKWQDLTISNVDELKELLPTAEGFFFGSTDYNGDYLYDLMLTVEQLERFTEKGDDGFYKNKGELYYSASW